MDIGGGGGGGGFGFFKKGDQPHTFPTIDSTNSASSSRATTSSKQSSIGFGSLNLSQIQHFLGDPNSKQSYSSSA